MEDSILLGTTPLIYPLPRENETGTVSKSEVAYIARENSKSFKRALHFLSPRTGGMR